MAELGTKYECYSCGAKFYDFGRPAPICPKCGANQKDVKRPDSASESAQAKRKKREDVPKAIPEPEDDLVPAPDEDIPLDEIEVPEGVVEEEVDFDDDEDGDAAATANTAPSDAAVSKCQSACPW